MAFTCIKKVSPLTYSHVSSEGCFYQFNVYGNVTLYLLLQNQKNLHFDKTSLNIYVWKEGNRNYPLCQTLDTIYN